ncbi:flagellar basal body P-ring protein FlgI [Rhodopirellula sp. JC639]|uniref:flagellar basal body P-ring protein FlgI n=1 Tax=Stieleria mannarensis TaxID=2755585 RepID=UPI002570144E|nr:flagellar basal body P-ring protein FlgI [Rhodopirellula sp. JC639]
MPGRTPESKRTDDTARPNALATDRRGLLLSISTSLLLGGTLTGCTSFLGRNGSPDENGVAKLLEAPEPPELIREAAAPRGLNAIQITGVGLANSLPGTGGPADPSPYRDQLIEEMRRNDVKSPNEILEQESNAIVRVYATIPPGAKRGDTVDLRIDSPAGSNATDLHGGWLLDTRLRLQQVLQGRVRKGELLAMGTGPIMPRAAFEGDADKRMKTQGVVLAGGTVQKTRNMGLVLRPEFQHVKVSSEIAAAINRRFFFFDGTTRRGVAKAVEDDYIELELHPRYEGSLGRYITVVRSIAINERQGNSQPRLQKLASMLSDPATASDAALQLEALGESAIPTLIAGLKTDNPELRFYAAEALAYLDRRDAIAPLAAAIADEPAFRYPALAALKGLEHPEVVDALMGLFQHPSIESRYGAFVTLRARNDSILALSPQKLGTALQFYQIDSTAPAAIVVSTREEPEVVVFGTPAPVRVGGAILGPNALIIKAESSEPGKLRISRFQVGRDDRRTTAPSTIDGLIQGIISIGGDYADVVEVLREAKSKGYIDDQLAIDPLPTALRTYYRDDEPSDDES